MGVSGSGALQRSRKSAAACLTTSTPLAPPDSPPVRLDFSPDLIAGLALEAGEEGVYVRMAEQVALRVGGHAGHRRWPGRRPCSSVVGCARLPRCRKHRTGDHAGANHATEEHLGSLSNRWEWTCWRLIAGSDSAGSARPTDSEDPRPRPCPSRCCNTRGRRNRTGSLPSEGSDRRRGRRLARTRSLTRHRAVRRQMRATRSRHWRVSPSGRTPNSGSAVSIASCCSILL